MPAGYRSYTGTQFDTIRGAANIGSDDGLVYLPPGIKTYGQGIPMPAPIIQRMSPEVDAFWIQNNTGTADLIGGVGLRIAKRNWIAGQWDDDAAGVLQSIVDTTDAQDRDSIDDFAILCTADDDGMYIGSKIPWGWLTVDIDTENSANAATLMEYWQSDGTWQLPLATSVKMSELIVSAGKTGTGETTYIWDPSPDWGKVGEVYAGAVLAAPNTSMPNGYYYSRLRIDGADVSAGNITCSALEIGIHLLEENIDDESTVSRGPNLNFYSEFCDAVVIIRNTAITANIAYQVSARARG